MCLLLVLLGADLGLWISFVVLAGVDLSECGSCWGRRGQMALRMWSKLGQSLVIDQCCASCYGGLRPMD